MRVGSLFSGIGGLDLGLERAGMTAAWQVEADPQCRSVLARHWPDVPRSDDVMEVHGEQHCRAGGGCAGCLGPVDVLTGGFPCQDVSVAGRRSGLGGARSGLWWELWRLMAELAPRWVVIENVPGLLSAVCADPDTGEPVPGGACPGGCMVTHGGAMGTVLGAVAGLGYGWAYRVLDARHFGVPQRRRRVFIVCRAGADQRCPAAVLLEPEGRSGGAPPSRAAEQDVAGTLGGGTAGRGWSDDLDRAGAFVPVVHGTLTGTHRGIPAGSGSERDALVAIGFSTQGTHGSGTWVEDGTPPLTGSRHDGMVAHALTTSGRRLDGQGETLLGVQVNLRREARLREVTGALEAQPSASQLNGVLTDVGVRRLMPIERERLQGFPDDWTAWGHDGAEMSGAARERMTGNAVAVPVAEWVGRRIMEAA